MKLKELTKEELEAMSYDDIALMILTESNKKMKINELFKEVCNLLSLSDDEYVSKLPSFFEILSTDHRFTMLEDGSWDLKTRHSTKVIIDSDDEEDLEEIDDLEDTEEEEDIFDEEDETDDIEDDDLKDLVIIDEDEEANGLS